jgi:hypothetical protein
LKKKEYKIENFIIKDCLINLKSDLNYAKYQLVFDQSFSLAINLLTISSAETG